MSRLEAACFIGYALSAFLVPFIKIGSWSGFKTTTVQIADWAFAATALLWLIGWSKKAFRLRLGAALPALLAYVGVSLLSVIFTDDRRAWALHFAALLYLVSWCVVTASLAETAVGRRVVVRSWLAGGAVTIACALIGVLLFYAGLRDRRVNPFLWNYGSVPTGNYPRIGVFFLNANALCNYFEIIVGVGFVALADAEHRLRRPLQIVIGLGVIATAFTLSVGIGGLVLGASVGWILWQRFTGRVRVGREVLIALVAAGVAIGFLAISVILLVPKGAGDLSLGIVDLQFARSGRVDTWAAAWHSFLGRPFTGIGLGKAPSMVDNARALHSMENWGTGVMKIHKTNAMEAHNIELSVLAQLGLPGFAAFVAFLAFALRGLLPRTGTRPNDALARIALFGTFLGAVVYHGQFGSFEESRQIWFLFGLLLAFAPRADSESRRTVSA